MRRRPNYAHIQPAVSIGTTDYVVPKLRHPSLFAQSSTPPRPTNGPFVKITGILKLLKSSIVSMHIPLSTVNVFMQADDALEYLQEFELNKLQDKEKEMPNTEQFADEQRLIALRYVTRMRKELDNIQELHPKKQVWFAQVSQEMAFSNDVVMIDPSDNHKVDRWMMGDPWHELVEMIRYSPLLGGADVQAAKERFEEHASE